MHDPVSRRAWFHRLSSVLIVALGAVLAPSESAHAQYGESTYVETWTDFRTDYNFSDRFRYDGDYGIRAWPSTEDFTQIFIRPKVRYEVNWWLRLHGGFAWFHTYFREGDDSDELRPWVGIRFEAPWIGPFQLRNYLRLEYRSFHFRTEGDSDSAWRGRWQIQMRSRDFKFLGLQRFYGLAFAEFFHTFESEVEGIQAERLRLNLGAGNRFASRWRAELNVMYQKGRVEEGITGFDLDEIIVRLRLFYAFN